ncbi:MAG: hypothetical protein IKT55_08770 [Clostridia bacterium]|nr:hypothetical protein [Clostridia bacterium]
MKKIAIVFLSLLIVLQCAVITGAVVYEGDSRYTIDLPEDFRQTGDNNFTADDESGFSVAFEDNVEEQFSVADMSKKDIEEYVKEMEENAKAILKEYDVDGSVKMLSAEKIKHVNGQYAIVLTVESSYTVDGKTTVNYHKVYEFSCVENKITFTYTVDKKDKLSNFDDAFDSIVIKEKEVESKLDKIKTAAFYVGLIIATAVVVIIFVKRRSK